MELIDKYVWYQEGPGVRKNQYTSSGVKLLNVANLVEGKIDLSTSSRYISEDEANGRYNHFLVDEGDLIIASSGIQVSYFEKKMGIAEKHHLPLCMNTSTIRFKVLDKKITDIRYFMYFLKSNLFKNQIRKLITGSAQLNFGPSHLKKIKIKVPELKKQQEIVRKLDKVKKIIDIRLNQIIELNELIKSQFVEMFKNVKRYVKLQKVCLFINGDRGENYPSGDKISKNKDGVAFINAGLLESNKVNWSNMNYISEDTYNNLRSGKIQKDDILYCLRGSLGKCAIIDFSKKGAIASSLVILRANKNEINPNFLLIQLGTEEILYQQNQANNGSSQPNLSANSVKKYKILLPPITLQNQFSAIVKQIDKQKFEIEKSLKETQELYESLMEKYFG